MNRNMKFDVAGAGALSFALLLLYYLGRARFYWFEWFVDAIWYAAAFVLISNLISLVRQRDKVKQISTNWIYCVMLLGGLSGVWKLYDQGEPTTGLAAIVHSDKIIEDRKKTSEIESLSKQVRDILARVEAIDTQSKSAVVANNLGKFEGELILRRLESGEILVKLNGNDLKGFNDIDETNVKND